MGNSIEIDVTCSVCGQALDVEQINAHGTSVELIVDRCLKCDKGLTEEVREEAYSDGFDAGVESVVKDED